MLLIQNETTEFVKEKLSSFCKQNGNATNFSFSRHSHKKVMWTSYNTLLYRYICCVNVQGIHFVI